MKIANISLDGRTFQQAALEFLERAPADEVFTLTELAAAISRPIPTSLHGFSQLKKSAIQGTVNHRQQR